MSRATGAVMGLNERGYDARAAGSQLRGEVDVQLILLRQGVDTSHTGFIDAVVQKFQGDPNGARPPCEGKGARKLLPIQRARKHS